MNVDQKNIFISRRTALTRAELLIIIAVAAVLFAMLIPALASASRRARNEANLALCKDNLRKLGIALLAYAQNNAGALPLADTLESPHTTLLHALSPSYLPDPKPFYCPSLEQPAFSNENLKAGNISYFYYSAASPGPDQKLSKFLRTALDWPRELNTRLDPATWLMSDIWLSGIPTAHEPYKKGVNFLTLNGEVQFLSESPRKQFH